MVDINDDKSESLEDEEGPQDDATPTSSTIKHQGELLLGPIMARYNFLNGHLYQMGTYNVKDIKTLFE